MLNAMLIFIGGVLGLIGIGLALRESTHVEA
jgi:hypothetical protein